jgi:hypothetical protein
MRGLDRAVTYTKRRRNEAVHAKHLKPYHRPDDIDYRIDGAHFVKVNRVGGRPVRPRFGPREPLEGPERAGAGEFRELAVSDDFAYVGKVARGLRRRFQLDIKLCRTDAASLNAVDFYLVASQAERS